MPRSARGLGCLLLVALLLAVGGSGCAKRKASPESEEGLIPPGAPGESTTPSSVFPHPDDWSNPALHGVWVGENGQTVCLECHAIEGTQSPPSCRSCHPFFPKPPGWVSAEGHGAVVLQQGAAGCGTLCHGADFGGGLSGVKCQDCHALFPHRPDWNRPENHGEQAEGLKRLLCQSCHGEDYAGGSSQVSCYGCHPLFPHRPDWGLKAQHGSYVLERGNAECSTQCHWADLSGGLSEVSCNRCHQVYPHRDRWGELHGDQFLALGANACVGCHGADLSEVVNGKTCFSCHEDGPHLNRATWIPFVGGHGEKVRVTYERNTETCQVCHGSDLARTLNGQSCFSCHPAAPSGRHGEAAGAPAWGTFEGHGQYTLANGRVQCQLCHGLMFNGGDRRNDSCFDCHPYPHLAGWRNPEGQPQGHGIFVQDFGTTTCATSHCHGIGLVSVPGTTRGDRCETCHQPTYPHVAGWLTERLHGPTALTDINDCKTCHGAGLDQAPPSFRTCTTCHPSYLRHDSAGLGLGGWWREMHGAYVRGPALGGDISGCRLCHGDDYSGGISGQSCRASGCHQSFPHDEPAWRERDHGLYVVAAPRNGNPEECRLCHGDDYAGGNTGIGCRGCHDHASFPHNQPVWDETGHGTYVMADPRNGDPGECRLCHGADYTSGNAGVGCRLACHDGDHTTFPHEMIPGVTADWGTREGHATWVHTTLGDNLASCQMCHGNDLLGGNTGQSCFECHAGYPHSAIDLPDAGIAETWAPVAGDGLPSEHGRFFSGRYNSMSEDASCWGCHGDPAVLSQDQDEISDILEMVEGFGPEAPSCYQAQCHHAYPHRNYAAAAGEVANDWEPADSCTPGGSWIHVLYLLDSPLLIMDNGERADADAEYPNAIERTCGRGDGSCHSGGNRGRYHPVAPLCNVCHGEGRPECPPEPTDCSSIAGVAPTVGSRTPAPGAIDIAVNSNITFSFNECMDRASLTSGGTITLRRQATGAVVDSEITCNDWCRTVTINPTANLEFNVAYVVRIVAGGRDYGGDSLAPQDWSFTTIPPDTFPPEVGSTNPAHTPPEDASDGRVPVQTVVTASFVDSRTGLPENIRPGAGRFRIFANPTDDIEEGQCPGAPSGTEVTASNISVFSNTISFTGPVEGVCTRVVRGEYRCRYSGCRDLPALCWGHYLAWIEEGAVEDLSLAHNRSAPYCWIFYTNSAECQADCSPEF